MKTKKIVLLLVLLLLNLAFRNPSASALEITNNEVSLNFPDSITFSASFESDVPITAVELEYGVDALTCGTVIAKAFPQFEPATSVDVEWTWEMKQSGSLPPGATLWWQWRYADESGAEKVSEKETIIWLDSEHDWQTVTSGYLNLHWYKGNQVFAEDLLGTAEEGLVLLEEDAGLVPDYPINFYIYGDTEDMKDAILYEPTWTGGLAYPGNSIVIIGISGNGDLEWGRGTVKHELTHIVVGHLTFSCLGDVPTWLNEGLAVYNEGELDQNSARQLQDAIDNDELFPLRTLNGGFSEDSIKANLSYSQSYSVVKFMVETYGQEKVNLVLVALRDGTAIDDALIKAYGFDVDGLEAEWRDAIHARPQQASAQPTAQATPTFVPTYVPYAGESLLITPTPFDMPTSSPEKDSPASDENGMLDPIALVLIYLCCCGGGILLFLSVGILIFFLVKKSKKGTENEKI